MDVPPPTKLVHQTNEHRPPELDPAAAAVIAAEQWGYHWAHVKRMEDKAKAAQNGDKDNTQCWLRRAVDELDASSVAFLRKDYADMFESGDQRWKVNMQKHIDKARELEQRSKDKDDA